MKPTKVHKTFKNSKVAQNMKSKDYLCGTCLGKNQLNVILRFTCNSSTHRVTKYKRVEVYYFNVIMRIIPENMMLHDTTT